MARNTTWIGVSVDELFEILLDAAAYPAWVVGSKRLAWVEREWPAPGSAFWIRFAAELREDKTEMLEIERPVRVVLRPHVRPFCVTRVVLDLEARGDATHVTFTETVQWPSQPRPARAIGDALLLLRNIESLRRLKLLAEGRSR